MISLNKLFNKNFSKLKPIDNTLIDYLSKILPPIYKQDDRGHWWETHIFSVIESAIKLAQMISIRRNISLDLNIVYAAAALHDISRYLGKDNHEINSGNFVRKMTKLNQWFTKNEIEIIAQAVEDHRASVGKQARSIYGEIVFDADRMGDLDIKVLLARCVHYRQKNNPELITQDDLFNNVFDYLIEKFGKTGYAKVITPEGQDMSNKLWKKRQELILNKKKLRKIFDENNYD